MYWSQGWGMYYSDPDTQIIILAQADLGSGCATTFIIPSIFSQYCGYIIDGVLVGTPVFVNAGVSTTFTGSYQSASGPHIVTVAAFGPFPLSSWFDVTEQQILFSQGRSDKIHLEIQSVPVQFSLDTAGA